MKNVARVFDAIKQGSRTAREVADTTGLRNTAVYLLQLHQVGAVKRQGPFRSTRGRPYFTYEAIQ